MLLILPLFSAAQIWDVIASGGTTVAQNGSSLCYTVGEAVIWQANGNDYNSQQGFQQCSFDFDCSTDIGDISSYKHSQLTLYPNPTVSEVTVSGLPLVTSTLSVFDTEGRNVLSVNIKENGRIDLSQLTAGQYTIALFDTDNRTVYSNSIIKTNQ